MFGEAVRGLTGLRRDPGAAARQAQVAGDAVPSIAPAVSKLLQYIPAFGDWTLLQPNADSFTIRKRTADGHAWLDSAARRRAPAASATVGGPAGGVAFGIRNFWQSHPAQLDIRGAQGDAATVTLWVWAPDAPPMDLRFYHDGLGQDTYEKQYKGGLEITYEDYEPGFGTPLGVARTSELHAVDPAGDTAARAACRSSRRRCAQPAVIVATPQTTVECGRVRPRVVAARRRRRRNMPRSRSSSTGCSISIAASRTSTAGTASGTTATSCTPTTSIATSGATTSAVSPGTTRSSPPTCGCGCISCARAAPTRSASPRR